MQSAGDVHEMYELSLQVEPREREDEKIARSVFPTNSLAGAGWGSATEYFDEVLRGGGGAGGAWKRQRNGLLMRT